MSYNFEDADYIGHMKEYYKDLKWDERLEIWKLPTEIGFCDYLATLDLPISYTTFKKWKKEYPELQKCCEECSERAKTMIVEMATNRKFDASISKFVLSANYGMSEKSQLEIGQDKDKPFEVNINIVKN